MVSAILLLGGSASISALTGMDIRAATMLLPVGVIAFVIVGGLRSTFVSDYAHTTIVFVVIWLFLYTVSISFDGWNDQANVTLNALGIRLEQAHWLSIRYACFARQGSGDRPGRGELAGLVSDLPVKARFHLFVSL